jgi:ubiquinone/menaquinone biosynthesis C-methylase UbiE
VNKGQDKTFLSQQHYRDDRKLIARRSLFDYEVPQIDWWDGMYRQLQVSPHGSILDVGCGTGEWLIYLREEQKHRGRLVGLDISSGMMRSGIEASQQRGLEIEFIVGSADELPFPDQSFDVITALHMLYHMPEIPKTLREIKRVLRPGGTFATSTNSQTERPKYVALVRSIGQMLQSGYEGPSAIKVQPAESFPSSFTLENGESLLRQIFSAVRRFEFESTIVLKEPTPYVDYIDSIRDFFEPSPSDKDWEEALTVVRAEIEKEICERGEFVDNKRRGFFIASGV